MAIAISVQLSDKEGITYCVESQSDSAVEALKELRTAIDELKAEGLEPVKASQEPAKAIESQPTPAVATPQPNGKAWVDDPEKMKNFGKLLEYRNLDLNSGLKLTGHSSWRAFATADDAIKAVDAKLATKEGAGEALDIEDDDVPDDLCRYVEPKEAKKEGPPVVPSNGDKSDLKVRRMELCQKATAAGIPRAHWDDLPEGCTVADVDKAEETLKRLIQQNVIASELRASLKRFVDDLEAGILPAGRDVIKLDDGRHVLYREGVGEIKDEAPLLLRIEGETEPNRNVIAAYVNKSRKARLADPLIGKVNTFMGVAYSKEATEEAEKDYFEYADIYELGEQPNTILEEARKEGPMTRDRWLALADELHKLSAEKATA